MSWIIPPFVPRRHRRRLQAEHGGLRVGPAPRSWRHWSHAHQATCSCGWKGVRWRAMPVGYPVTASELAISEMYEHVVDELERYEAEK